MLVFLHTKGNLYHMSIVTHLKSLQALELAIREGSLKGAAERLGITPAAVGQRIRTLEDYLGSDLLLRGRSGLQPTTELGPAITDLHQAFAALERASATLNFQRVSEIHIVADADWSDLWLLPRLPEFRAAYPNILFCINGHGDVPLRIGAADLTIEYGGETGEPLYRDVFLPITGPDNPRRIADWDSVNQMEGLPLLHLKRNYKNEDYPGWVEWFAKFGHRKTGADRGARYQHASSALEAAREDVGFLVLGLSLVLKDLENGAVVHPFPITQHIDAPHPYRLRVRSGVENRPQLRRFLEWLRKSAHTTQAQINTLKRQDQINSANPDQSAD